jgi:hypothetical protein
MKCLRFLGLAGIATLAVAASCAAQEVIDPEVAKNDLDFTIQGEYLGTGTIFSKDSELPLKKENGPIGAQVVALGDGKFDVYLLRGGLPGRGWQKYGWRVRIEGQRQGLVTELKGQFLRGHWIYSLPGGRPDDTDVGQARGRIADGKMTLSDANDGGRTAELQRVECRSPTLGAKLPAGAKVLFDGTTADKFDRGEMTHWKTLMSGPATKDKFNSYTLHLEFCLSWMPKARGQGRSNSGVYPHDCYEIQVLDSFGLEGRDNECGALYGLKAPDVNMCLPPMAWQTYDVEFTAPKYDASRKKTANAQMTVRHNGVVIHNHFDVPRGTPGRQGEGPGPRVLYLQGHGNKVQFRNIWLVEK